MEVAAAAAAEERRHPGRPGVSLLHVVVVLLLLGADSIHPMFRANDGDDDGHCIEEFDMVGSSCTLDEERTETKRRAGLMQHNDDDGDVNL